MKIRSVSAAAAALITTALLLAGCGSSVHDATQNSTSTTSPTEHRWDDKAEAGQPPYYHYSYYQTLPDGYKLLCVYAADDSRAGGPSCNWEAYNKHLNDQKAPQ
jgi:hypothetical protein